MTTIPFTEKVSFVLSNNDYDKNDDKILIINSDKEQIETYRKKTGSNTTYDLRIGSAYRDVRKAQPSAIDTNPIKIKPKMFIEVQTEECVKFPLNRTGRISSKVSILKKGLGVFPTNIDPGYEGQLIIYVCNFGNETVFLKPKTKFCSIIVESVTGTANAYDKAAKMLIGEEPRNLIDRISNWIKYNTLTISVIINILMLMATITIAVMTVLPKK